MIELPLIFVAGILGSSHCVGMCGPFALAIGGSAVKWRENIARQLIYTAGRIFTYAAMGAFAGFAGWRLASGLPMLRNCAAVLAVVAGLFLLWQGLRAAGVLRRKQLRASPSPCLAGTFFASFLKSPRSSDIFLAGLFTGMLPCGLVYGFLALAASSSHVGLGALLMTAFGLGTAPVMILTGSGASLLTLGVRKRLYQAAAWCVVLTGVLSIARGAGFVEIPGWHEAGGCPACQQTMLGKN